jgi:UDP-N-acetylglucosamine 3-dehydrogenase
MSKIGTAVIGTGFWGRNHARVYNELAQTELLAVCDSNPERARTVAKRFKAKPYINSGRMLRNEKIEAVSICTWSTSLAKEALKALKRGKHVLVEKPMATTVTQAKKLLETAQQKEVHLSVGFLMRFIPGIQQIKKSIETQEIGNLVCATAKRVSEWPERIGDVGVVKDLAVHDIDMARYLFNDEPTTVYAKIGRLKHRKYEDYAQIMLTFKEGKSTFIEANWLTPYRTRELVITGSKAIMKLDYISQTLTIESAEKTLQPRLPWKEPLKLELEHYANCIMKKEEPVITGTDGLKALKVAQSALKSSKIGRAVKLQ